MASFDMEDELINAEELSRLMEVSSSREKLNLNFKPCFSSAKTKDKPLMRTFANGLKFTRHGWISWTCQWGRLLRGL